MTSDLLAKYRAQLPRGASNQYGDHAAAFLLWAGARPLARITVEAYLAHLQRAGYAAGSQHTIFGVLRRLFKVNNLPWEFRRGEGPQISERDEYAPSLSPDVIAHLVQTVLTMDTEYQAHLALSTTYGLRREEMAEIGAHSFNWETGMVYVETAKHGRQRYHLVPGEVKAVLQAYQWPARHVSRISVIFSEIKIMAGLIGEQWHEVGWHAIRRGLNRTLLEGGMTETEVTIFLRWKRSRTSMAQRYATTTVLGMDGARPGMGLQDEALDRKAFSLIPWLKLWEA